MSTASLRFDTLHYSKKLREAGVSEQQAEVQAEALFELMEDNLATKGDILEIQKDIKALDKEIKATEERLSNKINELSYKLTIRLGGMIVAGIVVLGVLFKL